jgi:cbb3-type cytochrome oxidase maturation protein
MALSTLALIFLSLCVGAAVWLVFLWAVRRGEFDDPEGPKYRMLDDDEPAGGDSTTQGDRHDD